MAVKSVRFRETGDRDRSGEGTRREDLHDRRQAALAALDEIEAEERALNRIEDKANQIQNMVLGATVTQLQDFTDIASDLHRQHFESIEAAYAGHPLRSVIVPFKKAMSEITTIGPALNATANSIVASIPTTVELVTGYRNEVIGLGMSADLAEARRAQDVFAAETTAHVSRIHSAPEWERQDAVLQRDYAYEKDRGETQYAYEKDRAAYLYGYERDRADTQFRQDSERAETQFGYDTKRAAAQHHFDMESKEAETGSQWLMRQLDAVTDMSKLLVWMRRVDNPDSRAEETINMLETTLEAFSNASSGLDLSRKDQEAFAPLIRLNVEKVLATAQRERDRLDSMVFGTSMPNRQEPDQPASGPSPERRSDRPGPNRHDRSGGH